ncbi:Vegetative incompatibility protein HET-E-1 [Psilocybe cubensis]|uniref:Heterokaryon incompatibility domain-containing protein n=2 Tax=Psilocybe cubensis TaxID=181762 RepID=A0A8H7XLM7_PSICU|nr:Vegetative incompatibility protein HET-E-1 [Psilocybe cubensis]KAH9476311.1 Vegetative incompatibility protein HET-E-1 [Psilocybe cubensis]
MRLINTKTFQIEDFWSNIPVYAILSHTWEEEEVTFQEMQALSRWIKRKKGFKKIQKTCEQALADGFTYAWVDTCCIDKTSSSELSEAINSMYKWYQQAEVCYAYLTDVSASDNPFNQKSQFRECRWFTRGWTLQELIAPLSVVFYDKDWIEIGTKSSLCKIITEITNISKQVLLVNHGGEISIAARMSWASNRKTTKVEDMAYCLLGLFGINMPILYGEGQDAFSRLQREIIGTSDDQTIFAWAGGHGGTGVAGLLAKSPKDFAPSSHLSHIKVDTNRSPYSITNVGLSIELPLQPVSGNANQYKVLLNCLSGGSLVGIYLIKDKEGQYVRTRTTETFTDTADNLQRYKRERIYIKEPVPSRFDVTQWMKPRRDYEFFIKSMPSAQVHGFTATQFYPPPGTNAVEWSALPKSQHRLTIGHSGTSGGILFESKTGRYERFVVMLGLHNYNVWCDVYTNVGQSDTLEGIAKSYYKDNQVKLWDNLDRACKQLTLHDKYVVLSARKGVKPDKQGEFQYTVDITVTSNPPPVGSIGRSGGLELGMSNPAYVFHVMFDPTWEVTSLPAFESIAWHRQKDKSLTLALKNSGISGIVVLRDSVTQAVVAILLGIHNYKPWSDIVTTIKNDEGVEDEAKNVRKLYYTNVPGNLNHRLWAWDTDLEKSVNKNLSVRVVTKEDAKDSFATNIQITRL